MNQANIIAAIVAYHPDEGVFRNISSVSSQVDSVVVIDNTEGDSKMARRFAAAGVHYIDAGKNVGVGSALNMALDYAKGVGATWVLTLDQDSVIERGYVRKLLDCAERVKSEGAEVVSLGGVPVDPNNAYRLLTALPGTRAPHLITSGNLVRIDALSAIGGYRSDLFIDYVDLWVSMSLHSRGYRILQCEEAVFEHSLGSSNYRMFFGKRIRLSNHSAVRRYYITRNRLLFWYAAASLSPGYLPSELRHFAIDCIAVLLEENRPKKLKAMALAFFDVIIGKRGKCSYVL